MAVEVIVPYRRGSSDRRRAAFEHVLAHYEQAGFSVRTVDNDPWAPGRARNLGAAVSTADVLLFADADTVCSPMQLLEARDLATAEPGLVFAYTIYMRLTEESTGELYAGTGNVREALQRSGGPPPIGTDLEDLFKFRVEHPIFGSASMGAVAISAECFEELGGFDSGYTGWGYEDLDFVARATEKFGRCRRVEGPAWHLWHGGRRGDDSPEDAFPSEVTANFDRWRSTLTAR